MDILWGISDFQPTEKAFLETNTILNITHLITAFGFMMVTRQSTTITINYIRVIGMAYMLLSLIGFMGTSILMGEQWADMIYHNLLSYVQFGLGVTLSIFGTILSNRL